MYCNSAILALELNNTNEAYWKVVGGSDDTGGGISKFVRVNDSIERRRLRPPYLYWLFFNQTTTQLCFAYQVRSVPNDIMVFGFEVHYHTARLIWKFLRNFGLSARDYGQ
jgi:hypothetical protein